MVTPQVESDESSALQLLHATDLWGYAENICVYVARGHSGKRRNSLSQVKTNWEVERNQATEIKLPFDTLGDT